MTVCLGNLWGSLKKIEAPYVFNWEYDIALHEMQGNQASFPSEGYVSWDFSSCGKNVGYILELWRGSPLETPLEVLVESWLKSSIKYRESALILRRYVVHGTFFALLC